MLLFLAVAKVESLALEETAPAFAIFCNLLDSVALFTWVSAKNDMIVYYTKFDGK